MCDQVIRFLKEQGIQQGLVNIGGTIGAFGNAPDGKPWRVGLRHPRDPTRTLRVISLSNEAVSTRGDDEQFFVLNGRRYSNLLNPRTGYPANQSVAVSVVHPSAFLADALSTSFFILDPEKTPFLASQYRGGPLVSDLFHEWRAFQDPFFGTGVLMFESNSQWERPSCR